MRRSTIWLLTALVCGPTVPATDALAGAMNRPSPSPAQEKQAADVLTYRGYTVNTAELHGEPQKPAILQSVRQQIDIVESVRLPGPDREFFRGLPILFKDSLRKAPAHWNARLGRIELLPKVLERKPVLLQELLRAYHARRLPQGVENPEIRALHQAARKAAQQAAKEGDDPFPFLKNEREFFTTVAAAYLLGSIDQPPHTRKLLQQQQPDCYKFLSNLFGPQDVPEPTTVQSAPPRRPAARPSGAASR